MNENLSEILAGLHHYLEGLYCDASSKSFSMVLKPEAMLNLTQILMS
jgi:hypothetical protein